MVIDEKNTTGPSKPVIEARYILGETEQKLLLGLISMIQPQTETQRKHFHRISIQEFAQLLGKDEPDNFCKEVLHIARKLKKTNIETILPNGDTVKIPWVAGFTYPKNKGWIELEISSMLESELLGVKEQFTQYYLANISKFKGEYTTRIYELVRQYASSNLHSRKISLKEARDVFSLRGAYSQPSNPLRRVIRPAHKEINTKTDISFSFRPIKESRKIIAVEFFDIQRKTSIPPQHRENKDILQNISKYLELRGPEYVTEKINYVVSRKPQNFADYLYSALSNNHGEGFGSAQGTNTEAGRFEPGTIFEFGGRRYTFDSSGLRISDTKILNPEEMIQLSKLGLLTLISPEKVEQERREAHLAEYEKYRQETIDTYLASLSAPERQAAEESFVRNLNSFSREIFKERGWDSPVIDSLWRTLIEAKLKNLKSFEEFVQR